MNPNDQLFEYFNKFSPIHRSDVELLLRDSKTKVFSKGQIVLNPGQVQRHIYFLQDGLMMSYLDHDKKILVQAFAYAPGFCAIPESFPHQRPSSHFLQCLSKVSCIEISHTHLTNCFNESRNLERSFRVLTEHILAGVLMRQTELLTSSLEERFRRFAKRSPHLFQLVPHKYIASYLGMDPTNFSKLFNSIQI